MARLTGGPAADDSFRRWYAQVQRLVGDLAEDERHVLRAVELARTAAAQEGLALALTA